MIIATSRGSVFFHGRQNITLTKEKRRTYSPNSKRRKREKQVRKRKAKNPDDWGKSIPGEKQEYRQEKVGARREKGGAASVVCKSGKRKVSNL